MNARDGNDLLSSLMMRATVLVTFASTTQLLATEEKKKYHMGRKAPMKPPMAKPSTPLPATSESDRSALRGRPATGPAPSGSIRGRTDEKTAVAQSMKSAVSTSVELPRAQRIEAPAAMDSADVKIVTNSPHVRPFEIHVSPSVMRKLRLTPRSVVRVISSCDLLFLEVVLGSVAGNNAAVHPKTAAVLVDDEATISTELPEAVKTVADSCVLKVLAGDDELAFSRAAALRSMSDLQLQGALRHLLHGHVVCRSLVLTVSIASFQISFEVVAVTRNSAPLDGTLAAGIVGNHTQLHCCRDDVEGIEVAAKSDATGGHHEAGTPPTLQHLLIVGDFGTGKTFELKKELERALEQHPGLRVVNISVADIVRQCRDAATGEMTLSVALRRAIREATWITPSVVAIDDIHLLLPSKPSPAVASAWGVSHAAAAFCAEMDAVSKDSAVAVYATATSVEDVNASVMAANRLGRFIRQLDPPSTADGRMRILRSVFVSELSTKSKSTEGVENALRSVAEHAHGCTQRDLALLHALCVSAAFRRSATPDITAEDVSAAAKLLRPSALQNGMEITIPNVSWDDIGGSLEAKRALQECVRWCLGENKQLFDALGMAPPKGVLLYGPPGCSKTMLAKALARESKMNFIAVKGPEVFSKWVGDSEKAVREIFRKARAVAPCVVFIDELDGMCGHRGSGGVSDRVISQFLTELDGLPAAMSSKTDSIILVAATNRPENIDGAVLRPGRIDRKVYVGLPELTEREAIASLHLRKMPVVPELLASVVAERTEGYSGAEVVAVCKESAFQALERDFATSHVTIDDFEGALRKVKPRIAKSDVDWYKTWAAGGRR